MSSDDKKIRVLHVGEFIKGGVSTYLNALINEQLQDPAFEDVRIVVSRQHREFLPDVPDENLFLFDYPKRSVSGLRTLSRAVSDAVSKHQPSLVQLTSTFPGVIGRISKAVRKQSAAGQRPAVVYCAQGWSFLMDTSRLKRAVYSFVERALSKRCDRIICISENELEGAVRIGIPREKCVLVYNALSAAPPETIPVKVPDAVAEARARGDRVLLFIGRFDRQKGLDILSSVFDGDSKTGDVLLTAGGVAVDSEEIRFGSRMYDMGWSSAGQIGSLLEQSDGLLVPSRWEGFGLVATEAMRAGKAVVCSNRGGLPEVVEDGVTGVVLESLDSTTIESVIAGLSPTQLQQMGQAGKARFERLFTADRMHSKIRDVYQDALKAVAAQ